MKLWIAGTVDQVIAAARTGLPTCIVTNPTVVAQWTQAAAQPIEKIAYQVVKSTKLPLYIQLHGPTTEQFIKEAEHFRSISKLILPKLPSTLEGLAATRILAKQNISVLVTTVCSVNQAYLAAAAGADSICPYFARLEESGVSAAKFISSVAAMYAREGIKTKILPASIRTVAQAEAALLAGATGVIIFDELFRKLCVHPVTDSSLTGFEADWKKTFYQLENKLPKTKAKS